MLEKTQVKVVMYAWSCGRCGSGVVGVEGGGGDLVSALCMCVIF